MTEMVDLNGRKVDLQLHIHMFDEEVRAYLQKKGYSIREQGFVRRMLSYMCAHVGLCEQVDWKCFYEECINYLVACRIVESSDKKDPDDLRRVFEFICGLEGSRRHPCAFKITQEMAEDYLKYRRNRWERNKIYFFNTDRC